VELHVYMQRYTCEFVIRTVLKTCI